MFKYMTNLLYKKIVFLWLWKLRASPRNRPCLVTYIDGLCHLSLLTRCSETRKQWLGSPLSSVAIAILFYLVLSKTRLCWRYVALRSFGHVSNLFSSLNLDKAIGLPISSSPLHEQQIQKKLLEIFKDIWFFYWAWKMFECMMFVPNFIMFGHLGSSQEKISRTFGPIFSFLSQAPQMSEHDEIWPGHHALKLFPCQKMIFMFFLFFFKFSVTLE